jgi:hypothetical protein
VRNATKNRLARALGPAACGALATALAACAHGPAEKLAEPPKIEIPGGGRCKVGETQSHPLVVEWPAADRASLEARLQHGLVAVRAAGCDIEVLRGCQVGARYGYVGLTRKNDRVRIRNKDELYANLPLGAASLEGKLARYKGLDVEIALVGMFEAPAERTTRAELDGDCESATHVITGVQVGAFQFYAGGSGELRAGAKFGNAGVGAGTSAEREVLSADGAPARCDAATTADQRPPEGCGALIRIELTPLPPAVAPCPLGSSWNGESCASDAVAAARPSPARPAYAVTEEPPPEIPAPSGLAPAIPEVAPPPAHESDESALCRRSCERDLECKAESQGVAAPEGQGREAYLRMCARTCEFMVNDFTRPQLRACLEMKGCPAFEACVSPDAAAADTSGDFDTEGGW